MPRSRPECRLNSLTHDISCKREVISKRKLFTRVFNSVKPASSKPIDIEHETTRQKLRISLLIFVGIATCAADEVNRGRLVLSDTFDRSESQEERDEVGNGWTTNADKPWSKGKKQTDLRDGALFVSPADGEKSNVLVIRAADFRDGTIQFRFMLPHENDSIGLVIADKYLKNVHAVT